MTLLLSLVLAAPAPVLWRDPGKVEQVDFLKPAGGDPCPAPPFHFLEESHSGASPKVLVRDSTGTTWQVKGGPEGRADAFVTRLVSALGYYADSVCFVAEGRIEARPAKLRRAWRFIAEDGRFTWASFERRRPDLRFLGGHGWKWRQNPFAGTRELNGLRILIMLVSNWDNKDATNTWQGSNTGILEAQAAQSPEHIYYVTDWGQSLGQWRSILTGRPWDCGRFRAQTAHFVRAIRGGEIEFGFRGQHTAGFSDGIPVEHARWLLQYLSRITDAQLHAGLLASGATRQDQECFAKTLRERIGQLQQVERKQLALRYDETECSPGFVRSAAAKSRLLITSARSARRRALRNQRQRFLKRNRPPRRYRCSR